MSRIFDIEDRYYDLLKQLEEDGCDIEDITSKLLSLDGERLDLVRNMANFIRDCKALAKTRREAAQKITAQAKVKENAQERTEAFLLVYMQSCGMTRAEGDDVTVTVRNGTSYEYDEPNLPENYFKSNTVITLDKNMVKKDFKNGILKTGVITKPKQSLLIR